jgi:hypothetical protein
VITKEGVRVESSLFFATEMAGYEGERVQVKLDKTDLGTIYLYRENGEFLCVAEDPVRKGIDRVEMAARSKAIQKNVVQEGSKVLRKVAKKAATQMVHQEILTHRESLIANVVEMPQPVEIYTTQALEEAARASRARDQIEPQTPRENHEVVRQMRNQLETDMANAEKVVQIPADDRGRYRHWCRLEKRVAIGEKLGDDEQRFFKAFQTSSIWKTFKELEANCAVGHQ